MIASNKIQQRFTADSATLATELSNVCPQGDNDLLDVEVNSGSKFFVPNSSYPKQLVSSSTSVAGPSRPQEISVRIIMPSAREVVSAITGGQQHQSSHAANNSLEVVQVRPMAPEPTSDSTPRVMVSTSPAGATNTVIGVRDITHPCSDFRGACSDFRSFKAFVYNHRCLIIICVVALAGIVCMVLGLTILRHSTSSGAASSGSSGTSSNYGGGMSMPSGGGGSEPPVKRPTPVKPVIPHH